MSSLEKDVAVIIRSVGERTEALCKALVMNQVPRANVLLIRERPFGAAVRRTLELGIEKGQRWTLAVDADVLLRRHAIRDLLDWAETEKREFFFANFMVADRFLGEIRCGGAHLYRSSLLREGLRHADCTIDADERPESLVRVRMAGAGFPWLQVENLVIGLHGFEQSYRDIFRTSFTYALKHPASQIQRCARAWERLMERDEDFRVALAGAKAGMAVGGSPVIDDKIVPGSIRGINALAGVEEKPVLGADALDERSIAHLLGEFTPFVECIRCTGDFCTKERRMGFFAKVRKTFRNLGVSRFAVLALGAGLSRAGALLKGHAERGIVKR